MLVLADAGGSNGCRVGLFREKLWELSCQLGMSIRVAHFPSYCSKYNPIDHRLFSHVSRSLEGIIFSERRDGCQGDRAYNLDPLLRVHDEVHGASMWLIANGQPAITTRQRNPVKNWNLLFGGRESSNYSPSMRIAIAFSPAVPNPSLRSQRWRLGRKVVRGILRGGAATLGDCFRVSGARLVAYAFLTRPPATNG